MELTINERLPIYDIVLDGIAADLPLTDADPIHPDNVHDTMIQMLPSQVQGVDSAQNTSKILHLSSLLDTSATVITCAYKFHTGQLPLNFFTPDPKKDWFTETTPL